jgi:hypothetical protein
MVARVSEMLKDGDVRGAVWLAARDEKMAPYRNNTVDALISILALHTRHNIQQMMKLSLSSNRNQTKQSPSSLFQQAQRVV